MSVNTPAGIETLLSLSVRDYNFGFVQKPASLASVGFGNGRTVFWVNSIRSGGNVVLVSLG